VKKERWKANVEPKIAVSSTYYLLLIFQKLKPYSNGIRLCQESKVGSAKILTILKFNHVNLSQIRFSWFIEVLSNQN